MPFPQAKLDRREYGSLKQVTDDFHQMFVNAKRYNQKGSDIFNDAKRLDVSPECGVPILANNRLNTGGFIHIRNLQRDTMPS